MNDTETYGCACGERFDTPRELELHGQREIAKAEKEIAKQDAAREVFEADYVSYTMVTDSMVYQVVGRTSAGTMTLAPTKDTGKTVHTDGQALPVVWEGQEDDPDADTFQVRLRKDGTYRIGSNRLYPTPLFEGVPARRIDMKF